MVITKGLLGWVNKAFFCCSRIRFKRLGAKLWLRTWPLWKNRVQLWRTKVQWFYTFRRFSTWNYFSEMAWPTAWLGLVYGPDAVNHKCTINPDSAILYSWLGFSATVMNWETKVGFRLKGPAFGRKVESGVEISVQILQYSTFRLKVGPLSRNTTLGLPSWNFQVLSILNIFLNVRKNGLTNFFRFL